MRPGRTMLPTRLQRYNYFSEQQSHCSIFFETVLFYPIQIELIFKQLRTKSIETVIFSLFFCNFAVACDCSPGQRSNRTGHKQKGN